MEGQSAPPKTKADHYTARLFAAGGVRQTLTAVEDSVKSVGLQPLRDSFM